RRRGRGARAARAGGRRACGQRGIGARRRSGPELLMARGSIRYQLFLPVPLAERFEVLAAAPGASKSRLLAAAVEAWLDRKGFDALEQRFAVRLDRISRQLSRIERNGH